MDVRQNPVESVQDGCDERFPFRFAAKGFSVLFLFALCRRDESGAAFHVQIRAGTLRDGGEPHVEQRFFARDEEKLSGGVYGVERDLKAGAVERDHLAREHGLGERLLAERFADVEDQFFPDDRAWDLFGLGFGVFLSRCGFGAAARTGRFDPDSLFLLGGRSMTGSEMTST